MLKLVIFLKKFSLKINSNFYNIFMFKNYFIVFVLILFTSNSFACDALKLTGASVSKAQKTFFIIDGYSEEDFDEWATVQYVGYTADYCPKSNLENTYINVFVYKSKVVGIRLETMDVGVKENEIYEFLKNKYGDWIVYHPEISKNTILLWVIPLILFIFGGILIMRKVSIK